MKVLEDTHDRTPSRRNLERTWLRGVPFDAAMAPEADAEDDASVHCGNGTTL